MAVRIIPRVVRGRLYFQDFILLPTLPERAAAQPPVQPSADAPAVRP